MILNLKMVAFSDIRSSVFLDLSFDNNNKIIVQSIKFFRSGFFTITSAIAKLSASSESEYGLLVTWSCDHRVSCTARFKFTQLLSQEGCKWFQFWDCIPYKRENCLILVS